MRQGGSKCTSRANILEASKDCKRQVFQQKAEEIREMQNVHTYIISRPLLPFFCWPMAILYGHVVMSNMKKVFPIVSVPCGH